MILSNRIQSSAADGYVIFVHTRSIERARERGQLLGSVASIFMHVKPKEREIEKRNTNARGDERVKV